jgi:hypothetical protein
MSGMLCSSGLRPSLYTCRPSREPLRRLHLRGCAPPRRRAGRGGGTQPLGRRARARTGRRAQAVRAGRAREMPAPDARASSAHQRAPRGPTNKVWASCGRLRGVGRAGRLVHNVLAPAGVVSQPRRRVFEQHVCRPARACGDQLVSTHRAHCMTRFLRSGCVTPRVFALYAGPRAFPNRVLRRSILPACRDAARRSRRSVSARDASVVRCAWRISKEQNMLRKLGRSRTAIRAVY